MVLVVPKKYHSLISNLALQFVKTNCSKNSDGLVASEERNKPTTQDVEITLAPLAGSGSSSGNRSNNINSRCSSNISDSNNSSSSSSNSGGCSEFVPHSFKQGQCRHCFQPKSNHSASHTTTEQLTKTSTNYSNHHQLKKIPGKINLQRFQEAELAALAQTTKKQEEDAKRENIQTEMVAREAFRKGITAVRSFDFDTMITEFTTALDMLPGVYSRALEQRDWGKNGSSSSSSNTLSHPLFLAPTPLLCQQLCLLTAIKAFLKKLSKFVQFCLLPLCVLSTTTNNTNKYKYLHKQVHQTVAMKQCNEFTAHNPNNPDNLKITHESYNLDNSWRTHRINLITHSM